MKAEKLGPSEASSLIRRAVGHALQLQLCLMATTAAFTFVFYLSAPLIEAAANPLGIDNDVIVGVNMVVPAALISMFASWSSIWIVFGSGRWLTRLAITLAIFHVTVILWLGLSLSIEAVRESNTADSRWRDSLALIAGLSYAFAGQMVTSMFFVWLMKLFRFRLLYFDDANRYPHPRAVGREVPINERCETSVIASRFYLADMFVLTTFFAVYLAAWYPIVEVALQDNRMFGASFLFIIVLVFAGGNGLVGLPIVLFPLITTMLDRRGKIFQIYCHSIVVLIASASVTTLIWYQVVEEEGDVMLVAALLALLTYQTLLFMVMRKPTKWFRFRLVRVGRMVPSRPIRGVEQSGPAP